MTDSKKSNGKIAKEKNVVKKMIVLYCNKKHGTRNDNLCEECQELLTYSFQRLDNCRYGEDKPTCRKCPTHCYSPSERKQIKAVMRFSGMRLVIQAPFDWIRHKIHDR
ncbi:MAG: nitrous oxide-stimulated promoter family protein [Candidatus Thorarchaeota archaeon]